MIYSTGRRRKAALEPEAIVR